MNTVTARRTFSFLFNKGKLSLEKLTDKVTVDGAIDHVTIAFGDQYGRLWSTQVNAEYFINRVKAGETFLYTGNPFNKDVLGKEIDMPESIKFEENLHLRIDLSTLQQGELAQSGAFVLADPVNFNFAPRFLLRELIKKNESNVVDPMIELSFTAGLQKHKPDETIPVPHDHGILTQGWQQNFQIAVAVENTLRSNGIPVMQFQHLGGDYNQTKFSFIKKQNQTKDDLLIYADAFHMAKWLVKHEAISSGFLSNFVPSEGGAINLTTSLQTHNMVDRLSIYLPTLNSIRKVCSKEDQEASLGILQSDTNLYRVFADLIVSRQTDGSQEPQMLPKSFRSAIKVIEDQIAQNEDCYFNRLIAHEVKQVYESSPTEIDRVF